ncbi:DNA methyltransferase [Lacticaseibacillus paracasei subsp. paracasei Lpp41]|uniref:site-specific DNA-methyltransferase (adenine-specific) n=1 Tax=Lacticaseibacillus paracasei subsp. paracasei Lpp41 TaxID=1256208 RepID=A0A829H2X7_LACPA|nr:DNA methyltransferase [Lacticaseibacillus paracasei subsp. paracasei Lpp41]
MKNERLIKSSQRVKDHGEVFTPHRVVTLMLDQPEIKRALNSLTATFLEPAAGEGAFLTEILSRKLVLASQLSDSIEAFEQKALIALTSLYGIELLVDNTELLVMHMYRVFYQEYLRQISKYHASENKKVVKSALTILKANLVQGDALTGKNKNGDDIVFSEWTLLPVKRGVQKVQRTEYTLEAIRTDGPSLDGQPQVHGSEELTLFDLEEDPEKITPHKFEPVPLLEIFREKHVPE